jgi:hypothetical protein
MGFRRMALVLNSQSGIPSTGVDAAHGMLGEGG